MSYRPKGAASENVLWYIQALRAGGSNVKQHESTVEVSDRPISSPTLKPSGLFKSVQVEEGSLPDGWSQSSQGSPEPDAPAGQTFQPSPSTSKPTWAHAFAEQPDQEDAPSLARSEISGLSLPSNTERLLLDLQARVRRAELAAARKDEMLDVVFRRMEGQVNVLRRDLSAVAVQPQPPPPVSVTLESIPADVRNRLIQSVLSQVRREAGWVDHEELKRAVENLGVDSVTLSRLDDVEKEIFSSPGAIARLMARVELLEAALSSTTIEVGGVLFTDENAVHAWLSGLNETEVNRLVPDFVSMFLLAEPKFESVEQGVSTTAAAIKAHFSSLDLATIDLSYRLIYPDRILKSSDKESAIADTDGVDWAAGFASHSAFEGTYGNQGTHHRLKKRINNIKRAMEGGIDVTFPARLHPKANSVFKAHLALTVEQCLTFLDSLTPLFKRVSGAGLSDKENWLKCLAYTKYVFDDVATVRTINSEATIGSMVWASFRTAEHLKSYQLHNWVGHPQTSNILAFTSIQKEGKAQRDTAATLDSHKSTLNRLEREFSKLKDELKELKRKNPSIN